MNPRALFASPLAMCVACGSSVDQPLQVDDDGVWVTLESIDAGDGRPGWTTTPAAECCSLPTTLPNRIESCAPRRVPVDLRVAPAGRTQRARRPVARSTTSAGRTQRARVSTNRSLDAPGSSGGAVSTVSPARTGVTPAATSPATGGRCGSASSAPGPRRATVLARSSHRRGRTRQRQRCGVSPGVPDPENLYGFGVNAIED